MNGVFCKDRWRGQSWNRFQRQVRKESTRAPARGAEAQWYRDMLYIEMLETIIGWCATRGISVQFSKTANGLYQPETKSIILSGRASPEKQLHYLLHECGHHLIGMKEQHERFGEGYPKASEPRATMKSIYRMACLEEEFEAWHRGWKLAKRLGLNIDRIEFDKTRLDCLKSYLGWTKRTKRPAK